jgi:hypothetical protein
MTSREFSFLAALLRTAFLVGIATLAYVLSPNTPYFNAWYSPGSLCWLFVVVYGSYRFDDRVERHLRKNRNRAPSKEPGAEADHARQKN